MLAQRGHVFPAVVPAIFDLLAERAWRHPDKHELLVLRGHAPAFCASRRNVRTVAARRIRKTVARCALPADLSATVRSAPHVLRVHVAVVTLEGCVAARVAVLATRMLKHLPHSVEGSERASVH